MGTWGNQGNCRNPIISPFLCPGVISFYPPETQVPQRRSSTEGTNSCKICPELCLSHITSILSHLHDPFSHHFFSSCFVLIIFFTRLFSSLRPQQRNEAAVARQPTARSCRGWAVTWMLWGAIHKYFSRMQCVSCFPRRLLSLSRSTEHLPTSPACCSSFVVYASSVLCF